MARREAIFAEHNIDSMASYRRARRAGRYTDIDPYGDVFLVSTAGTRSGRTSTTSRTGSPRLAARGLSFGIHLVIASNRWSEMRPWLRDVMGTRFELKLGDPVDSEINSRFAATVPAIPGRGITPDRLHFLRRAPPNRRIVSTPTTWPRRRSSWRRHWPCPTAPAAPKVRLLPHMLPVDGAARRPPPRNPAAEMRDRARHRGRRAGPPVARLRRQPAPAGLRRRGKREDEPAAAHRPARWPRTTPPTRQG